MNNQSLSELFRDLSTPLVADACVRLGMPLRLAPHGVRALLPATPVAGRALPARHAGSVDVFFEAMETAETGDVLVIDNAGRTDEGCIGDLTVLEAQASGLAAIVAWGCHRDTTELVRIGFPVYSHGTCPAGPVRVDPREADALIAAHFGACIVGRDDYIFADDDGVLFVSADRLEDVLAMARSIWQTERRQADAVRAGQTLREQLRFKDFLAQRSVDPSYTLRRHLRQIGGAIEE